MDEMVELILLALRARMVACGIQLGQANTAPGSLTEAEFHALRALAGHYRSAQAGNCEERLAAMAEDGTFNNPALGGITLAKLQQAEGAVLA